MMALDLVFHRRSRSPRWAPQSQSHRGGTPYPRNNGQAHAHAFLAGESCLRRVVVYAQDFEGVCVEKRVM